VPVRAITVEPQGLQVGGGNPTVSGLNTVEGAVFALMGLVLAFAISGALQRFDERKQLILQEINAIGTAYDRLDLLENPARLELKSAMKAYLRDRIDLYQKGISFSFRQGAEVASEDRLARLSELKTAIWDGAVKACAPAEKKPVCILILPSLNSTFDAGQLRDGANERHPPHVLYVMLFGLGLGGSLLAGFGMAATKTRSWVHMVIFAAAMGLQRFPGVWPLLSGMVAEMFGTRYMATLLGISFVVHQVGASLGAWGGGIILDVTGSYDDAWKIGVSVGFAAGIVQIVAGGPVHPREARGEPQLVST